ncbi:MAG: hypothetical protein U0R50_00825 [Gaiellales bacterium]
MRLARIFWIGAAAMLIVAALIAVGAILSGSFDDTDARILGTIVNLVFAGGTAAAANTLRERPGPRLLGPAALIGAVVELLVVATAIWVSTEEGDNGNLLRAAWSTVVVLGALLVATLAALLSKTNTTNRLSKASGFATVLGAITTTALICRDNGDGWQLAAVLWIAGLLCAGLVPILERLRGSAPDAHKPERVLASLDDVEVVAVRAAHPDGIPVSLERGEWLILRRRAARP